MAAEHEMSVDERRKYLKLMQRRYEQADRAQRGRLLDEMEAVTKLHRKSLLRLLGQGLERKKRSKQRGSSYSAEVERAVALIADSIDHPCAERLTPNLVWLAEHLVQHGEMEADAELMAELGSISTSSVRRLLKRAGRDERRLPVKGVERARQALRDVPMRRIPWDEPQPGHMEVDLVHHSGRSSDGEYLHTLQLVDVTTGWSERVAVLGRSHLAMEAGFRRILERLPFPLLELHPDNGSEFLNHCLLRFYREVANIARLSRSRPYHKNDNRFVEQKNSSLVRAYLGYARLDSPSQAQAVNRLYDYMWLYYNLFQPVMHIAQKLLVPTPSGHSRIRRHYDQARTPFDRLCATGAIPAQRRQELEQLRADTNPRWLKERIYDLLEQIPKLPGAWGVHNVRQVMATLEEAPALPELARELALSQI